MKRLVSVLVLLAWVGVGRAGEKEIIKRLEAEGASVNPIEGGGLLVSLDASNLDASLTELCELRSLRHLGLIRTRLTDNQVRRICALPGLTSLGFSGCPITDARLKIVARVRGLEELYLTDTAITDADLAELTRFSDLKTLYLCSESITDVGLRHLEGMRGLTRLELNKCPHVTDEGIARLKKALPKCKIYR